MLDKDYWWMKSNPEPIVPQPTTLPTVPQPLLAFTWQFAQCLVTSLGRFIKDVDGSIERKTFIGMRIPGQKFRQDKARWRFWRLLRHCRRHAWRKLRQKVGEVGPYDAKRTSSSRQSPPRSLWTLERLDACWWRWQERWATNRESFVLPEHRRDLHRCLKM